MTESVFFNTWTMMGRVELYSVVWLYGGVAELWLYAGFHATPDAPPPTMPQNNIYTMNLPKLVCQ